MPETFLILLCGGVMLASAVPSPRQVTLHWLRLGGIIALTMLGLSAFFWQRRGSALATHQQSLLYLICAIAVCGQLALVQVGKPVVGRFLALFAMAASAMLGATLLDASAASVREITAQTPPYPAMLIGCIGVAALSGIALMEMLLGHAYLTAAKMTIAPMLRMNIVFALTLSLRMLMSLCAILMQPRWPIELFWARHGLYVGTRWLIGLMVPAIFIYMTHDCIRRRSTQSATGILYVTGVLIFIGELIALDLIRETGLPF